MYGRTSICTGIVFNCVRENVLRQKNKTDKTKIEQTSSVLGNGSDANECFLGSYCVCETLVGSMHVRHTGHLLGPTLQMKC